MARASKSATSTAIATPKGSQALSTLDAQLSQEVSALRDSIRGPAGNAIKVQPTGTFTLPDGTDLGDSFQAVVVDFTSKNMLYTTQYDPNNPAPPVCFAVDKIIANLKPVAESPEPQADSCSVCQMNQFKSAQNGRAKACKNTYELTLLFVDPDVPDAHNAPDAPLYTFSLSPTNMRPFDGFVSNCGRVLNGPPIKAIVTMTATPMGTYAAVAFSDMVPNPNYAEHILRRPEAAEMLARVPDFTPRQAPARTARPAPRRAGAAPSRR